MKKILVTLLMCLIGLTLVAGGKGGETGTVELTLEVVPEGSIVELAWKVAAGREVDFFTIEQTEDFRDVHRVALLFGPDPGHERETIRYADRCEYGETVYYRVRQTLVSGESITSAWVEVVW